MRAVPRVHARLPDGALIAPYVLDSNRCIAYLPIEHRGPIPRELRPLMGDWAFGCDVCQDACPVNERRQAPAQEPVSATLHEWLDLVALLEMDEATFKARFAGSPIRRAGHQGMQRNACVTLGNLKTQRRCRCLSGRCGRPRLWCEGTRRGRWAGLGVRRRGWHLSRRPWRRRMRG
ncbi:MAG: hypothetical protein EXR48_03170 [Dehalococcoidia bacterium]|nr:hypothetical protein [Dehalococcoidia bacterium]